MTLFELTKTEFITNYNKKFAKSRVHSRCFNLEMKSESLNGMVRMSPSSIIADFKTFFDRYSFGVVVTIIIRWVNEYLTINEHANHTQGEIKNPAAAGVVNQLLSGLELKLCRRGGFCGGFS